MEQKAQKIEDKIKDLKQQIIANSKDAEWAKKMLVHLTSLQKQADVESVELVVPVKEVKRTLDFDAYTLKKTPRGILFTAKGGLHTFVESRMQAVHEMLDRVFYIRDNPAEDDETKNLHSAYGDAVAYCLQAPIFCSLGEKTLFDVASTLLRCFDEHCKENYENAELHEETEEDIKANADFENAGKAIETIADAPLPPAPPED